MKPKTYKKSKKLLSLLVIKCYSKVNRINLFVLILLLATVIVHSSYKSGAPAGTTNAPGEKSCYDSPACHGGTPNTGTGYAKIVIMGDDEATTYNPGTTYLLMPFIDDASKQVGGFQTVAQLANGNSAGSVTITMPMNTYLITSGGQEYVNQTDTGAVEPVMSNMHDWMYEWEAPPAGSGTVFIYAAFVAGDGDSTVSGDNIYTDTLILYEDTTSSIFNHFNQNDGFIESVYPTPTKDVINIIFNPKYILSEVNISISDISGKVIINKKISLNESSNYQLDVSNLISGIYFVKIKENEISYSVRKIIKI